MSAGVILCGGAGRRMGQPKADLDFLGEPLLIRMIRIVQAVCHPIVVAAGPTQAMPELPSDVVVARDASEFQGPVFGLQAALRELPADCIHAFAVGCDMPLLRTETIQQFVAAAQPGQAVVGFYSGQAQPLPAIYPVAESLQPDVVDSLRKLLSQLSIIEIPEATLRQCDPDLASFQPMNTPDELAAALQRASS